MKIIKGKSLISLLCLSIFLAVPMVALADDPMPDSGDLPDITFKEILENAIGWLAGIVALVSIIVIIIGGIFWATAGGDEDRTKSSKKYLIGGIGGLIIALAAYAIVQVIISVFFEV